MGPRAATPHSALSLKSVGFLDLFSGKGGVSRAVRARGIQAWEFDVKNGDAFDLTNSNVLKNIERKISKSMVVACMLAPPCSSFSRARDRTSVIRTAQKPWGVPKHILSDADALRVQVGNRCVRAALRMIRALERHQVPWILEQPLTSRMWDLGPFRQLRKQSHIAFESLHQCQYGTRWRKATGLLCSRVDPFDRDRLSKMCGGKSGVCSRTGQRHLQLSGRDPKSNRLWTQIAEPYPTRLCEALAFAVLGRWRVLRTGVS